MPYKIHKTSGGKFKLYREKVGDKPARPMSKHPQTKETATAQLRAVEANTKPETHSATSLYAIKKLPSGKFQVSRNRGLETMSGPPHEKRGKDGKWVTTPTHKMETMAGPPDEARDDGGKWTSGPGSQGGSKPQSQVKSPSSGISDQKKYEIRMGREASERGMARTDKPVPKDVSSGSPKTYPTSGPNIKADATQHPKKPSLKSLIRKAVTNRNNRLNKKWSDEMANA